MFAVTHSGGVLRDGRPLTCQEGAHKRENINSLLLLSLNMLLFLLCCTPGVLCFVVVALLVACSRSVAKASSQCSHSVAVCFLAVLRSSFLCTPQCLCSRPPPGGPQVTTRGGGVPQHIPGSCCVPWSQWQDAKNPSKLSTMVARLTL